MMKKAQLSDFEYITKQNLNYQQTKSYLDITGVIYTDLKAYIDSLLSIYQFSKQGE